MIRSLQYIPNEKAAAEIAVFDKERADFLAKIEEADSVSAYYNSHRHETPWLEFVKRVGSKDPLKVLDIGFGRGQTSLYLAQRGHEVHAVEPSPVLCEVLEKASAKYRLPIAIYQGGGENIDQINDEGFDLCVFNSSLHHCDDPIKALKACHAKLKSGGKVLLVNEPILKFYRTKKWFDRQLHDDPVSLGHYGGNEHIYYFHEYVRLLRDSGFSDIRHFLHERHQHPRLTIRDDLDKMLGHSYVLSDRKILFKFSILLLIKYLTSVPAVGSLVTGLGKRLSLFPMSFEAYKS
jgi:SAM-dependent methyltransferase